MKPPSKANVDQLGRVKARIAELVEKEDQLKKPLVDYHAATGVGEFHGNLFDATVSVFGRETLDMEAVRAKLSKKFIATHTTVKDVTQVRVTARKRS